MRKGWVLAAAFIAVGVGSASVVPAATVYAIDDNPGQHLITFDSATPGNLTSSFAITGLQPNEKLVGIDVRWTTGGLNQNELYGVGSFGRIYVVNTTNGAATFAASIVGAVLNGTEFGADFDPQADRLRVVSDLDQNLRINVDSGITIVDTPLNPGAVNVTGGAYDRSDQSAVTPTTLFGIDTVANQLVRIGGVDGTPSPDGGTATPVGAPLGTDPASVGGFDIATNGVAFAAFRLNTPLIPGADGSTFYSINLTTGVATFIGHIGNPEDDLVIKGIAIPVVIPEPETVSLLGLTGLAALSRRRRAANEPARLLL